MSQTEQTYVLVVEDDPAQQRLMQEALKETGRDVKLVAATSGAEAMALMQRERPNLILLDLSLPAMDGREVLKALKRDSRLNYIPIVVFTASSAEHDIVSAYSAGANCYLQKPPDFPELVRCMSALLNFWTDTASLPPPDYADRRGRRMAEMWSK